MLNSFKFAVQGIKDALKSEPNLKFHFIAAVLVLIFAYFLNFSFQELTILTITIAFVIALELVNTIVEKLVDMHSKEISEEARAIKDMSAGVVLLGAIASIIIGLILFGSKIFS